MKKLLFFILFPWCACAMDGLSALSMVESGHNDRAVGRAGEISRYQVKKREWHSVTNSHAYTNPKVATDVTRRLLNNRIQKFEKKHRRTPTSYEVYVLWNAPAQALSGRISRVVAERARRFANLCEPNWFARDHLVASARAYQ